MRHLRPNLRAPVHHANREAGSLHSGGGMRHHTVVENGEPARCAEGFIDLVTGLAVSVRQTSVRLVSPRGSSCRKKPSQDPTDMEVPTALNTPGPRMAPGASSRGGAGTETATDIASRTVISEGRGQNSTCNAINFRIYFRKRIQGICQRCGVPKKGPFLPIAAV